ncbi:unnamed protein product [Camellia sinensis]
MLVLVVLGVGFCSNLGFGHEGHSSGSSESAVRDDHAHHHCDHGHGHRHHHHDHHHEERMVESKKLLPEELAEEEDLKLYGFGSHHGQHHHHDHDHDHHHEHGALELSGARLWIHAMGCSLLAGAMLGDAFLHQLPHAFEKINSKKLKDDNDDDDKIQQQSLNEKNECISEISSQGKVLDGGFEKQNQLESLWKRKTGSGAGEDNISDAPNGSPDHINPWHNFTDGMALGSAFLLYGSVGGWSRTLFLLAFELPQEGHNGDFGILVRSGFRTALGFTAGGFVYIAVAGVLVEMNNGSSSAIKSIAFQLTSLISGMAVALCISLVE